MKTHIHVKTTQFHEPDEFGCDVDMVRITVTIVHQGIGVWTSQIETNDDVDAVCSVREELYADAEKVAVSDYGFKPETVSA